MNNELIIDLFCGGGGASTGIELALGRPVDIAINHDEDAIAMHTANHSGTLHYTEDIFAVNPYEAVKGRTVGLLWASPDCTHFSKAKGGKPRSGKIRSLASVVVEWAKAVRPRVIMLENEEVRAVISEYYAGVFWLLDGNVLTVEDIIGVAE